MRLFSGLTRILLVGALAFPTLPASGPPEAQDVPLDMRFAQVERVQLVLVPAVVTDGKGRPVAGLTREDFSLIDHGEVRPIEFFGTESDSAVALAFMLDLSGSMRQEGKIDAAREAIASFTGRLSGEDRFGLIGFADEQVAWITDFTSDQGLFLRRLAVQEAYGQTALYDALAASPGLVNERLESRKAIVLFTDGLDNASRMGPLEAVQVARRVGVPIYTIGFLNVPEEMLSPESREAGLLLQRFCRETGGRAFMVRRPEELKSVMEAIQADLRFQYVVGFQPAASGSDRGFRRIILQPSRSRLRVRCRAGYYPGP